MVGATRTAFDQSALRSRLRAPDSSRPRVARRSYVNDIVVSRNEAKYATVRGGKKKTAAPKRPTSVAVPSLPRQSKSSTLRRDAVRYNRPRRKKQLQFKRLAFSALAILFVAAGGLISYNGWRANQTIEQQAAALTRDANAAAKTADRVSASSPKTAPTDSSGNPIPATDQPTAAEIAAYTVAPNMPRYLVISRIGVKARVMQLGLTKTGALATPSNVFDTGWYTGSAQPGKPGATLIDGHISSWTTHGVFYNLKDLKAGDQMQIVRGDGITITYQVVKTQTYADTNTDMTSALTPVVAGTPGLNLISCYGSVKPGTSEFNQRIVVYTKQVAES